MNNNSSYILTTHYRLCESVIKTSTGASVVCAKNQGLDFIRVGDFCLLKPWGLYNFHYSDDPM